ncbi:MAG TPA: condensation domain-containing protein [Pseudonocardiaceae bacterium]|nr:condensation domain-containing protein [Pseudonocardiaceae bacterium]
MVARILVPFHGEGEGVGELTWAQMGLWEGMVVAGRSVTMSGSAPTQPGTTVEQLAELLGFLVGRHQALRTRLRFRDPGTPLQVCVTSGEVPLEIVDTDGDPAEAAKAVEARYKEVDFDYETEFPIRMAVIRRDGAPAHMVAVYLHTVLDAGGLTALRNDMFARDPVTGAAAAPVTAIQPLEQARRQQSGSGRRQSDAAMVYLEHALRTMHPSQFGTPRHPDRGIRMINYRSPATALAVERIAAQERLNTSSVLLAVFAVALARHTGIGQVMAMLMVGNRFRPGFAESVSPLVQLSPYLIDVGGVSLREATERARTSVFNAYKNAYYDPYAQEAAINRVKAERGDIDYSCIYNDRRRQDRDAIPEKPATDNEILAALPLAEHEWLYRPAMSTRRLFLTVDDSPDAVDFLMTADTRFFSDADIIALTASFENVAVQTALGPTQPTGVPMSRPVPVPIRPISADPYQSRGVKLP